MFWKIKYVVDDGYTWHYRVCIINAAYVDDAIKIFDAEINKKLKGESYVIEKYTRVEQCENNVVLYDGTDC